ncbi:MAG: MmgE/PrpD family protein [Candidatus Rokubacteria bacterium]|nr:MmgE/PrpD family protein [Candidatus Rokubacteria bacterium]
MAKTLTEHFGEFVAQTKLAELPPEVIAKAKTCLLHNLGVALAGRRAEELVHSLVARAYAIPRESTLFWDGSRASAEGATLANAALMHARTQDDTHFPSSTHTGSTVIPAALAMAEAHGRTGGEFLTAMVLGYEVAARVGREYDTITTPRGFRATSIFGVFGAAAAAARLMGLPAEGVASALGFAANLAGGLGQTWIEGSSEWRFQVGIAGRNGIFAARIAARGAVAARESLEGVAGFYQAFGGTLDPAETTTAGLGKDWEILEVTLKPFPVCAIHQSPVGMMIQLATTHELRPDHVAEIILHLSPYEATYPGINGLGPFSDQGGTLMSAQYCMALALIDRKATLDGLFRFDDPTIRELSKRVRVVSDESLAPLCSRLSVRTVDGRLLTAETVATPTTHRFTFDEDAALIRALAPEMVEPADRTERLVEAVRGLERQPGLTQLLSCFKRPARPRGRRRNHRQHSRKGGNR